MPKILFISGSLPPIKDGVGDYSYKLLNKLCSKFHIEVLSTSNNCDICKKIHILENWRLSNIFNLFKIIQFRRYNIIHIQYPCVNYKRQLLVNLLPIFAKTINPKIKIIITVHNYFKNYTFLGKLRYFLLLFKADYIIAVSEKIKQHILEIPLISSIPNSKINIGSNFNFIYQKRVLYKCEDNSIINIGYFGFINHTKLIENLIEGLDYIKKQGYNFKWHILAELNSDNPYHKKILDLMDHTNLGNNTIIYGYQDEEQLLKIFNIVDIMILFYRDGVDLNKSSFLASVQCGIPVLSNKSEIQISAEIEHEKNCILVNDINPESILSAYNSILNPNNYNHISNNLSQLSQTFSWSEIAKKHEEIYNKI